MKPRVFIMPAGQGCVSIKKEVMMCVHPARCGINLA
jgi:hypothetical protein